MINDPFAFMGGYATEPPPSIHPKFKFIPEEYTDNRTQEHLVWRTTVFNFTGFIYKICWALLFGFLIFLFVKGLLPRSNKKQESPSENA